MASFRRRSGKWQAQVRRNGFPPAIKTFNRKAEAIEWARRVELRFDRSELEPDRKILAKTTLGDVITRYRDEVVPTKRGSRDETIVLNAFLRHDISKKLLSQLSSDDFVEYRDERLQYVSLQTLRRQLTPIRSALNMAMLEWRLPLRCNPLLGLKLKVVDNKRHRRLREGELDRLLKATSKNRNPLIKPIILLALETAMRRGEILGLRVHDVDIERCTATIRESKNGHSRTIPLSSLAVALLETTIAVMSDKAKAQNGRVFPLSPVAVRLAWDRLTKRAKIEDLHFHDLRHEAISRFFEKGLTVPEVASISGHRDIRMLLRYAHADREKLAKKLDG